MLTVLLNFDVSSRLPIDEDDVGLLFDDLHRGRSTAPPYDVPSRPTLVRWDPAKPLSLENCIVLEHADAEKHAAECYVGGKRPEDVWGPEVVEAVRRRADEMRRVREWVL